MKLTNWILALTLFAMACGTPVSSDPAPEPITKDEARSMGGKSDHIDWCEELGWYGDDICDDFCPEPDPDCEEEIDCTVAFVVPHCESAEMLVDDLTCEVAGSACRTHELCGVTSNCLFVGEFCPQVVGTPPACDADSREVDTCETSECQIVHGTGDDCADVKFCEPELDCTVAFVVPGCDPGGLLVDGMTCLAAGDECSSSVTCGVWSHCLQVGEFCPQVVGTPASCPADTTEVDACHSESCHIARGSGDDCTDVAFCEPFFNCLALPSCGPGELNVSTQTCFDRGDSCNTNTVCGQTLHCIDAPQICPQVVGTPPSCPSGTSEAPMCGTPQLNDGTCSLIFGSGDQCSNFLYCLQ